MEKITFAMTELDKRRDDLADNLNAKGVSASITETLDTLVPKVLEIEGGGSSSWQPDPLWWDIKKIVNTGTLEWDNQTVENIRAGYLVNDDHDTTKLTAGYEYYLSDGSYYPVSSNDVVHTWDKTKDKTPTLGYPTTRAVIMCKESKEISINISAFSTSGADIVYIYLGDCIVGTIADSSSVSKPLLAFDVSPLTVGTPSSMLKFYYCKELIYVKIPEGVTSLPPTAFQSDYALQEIIMPDGITSIGSSSFSNLYNLKSLRIPKGVQSYTASGIVYLGYALSYLYLPNTVNIPVTNTLLINSLSSLRTIEVENGFNVPLDVSALPSPLNTTSLEQIITNYADRSSTTALVFTMGAANLAKLSQEYIDLAASKNITLE